MDTGVETKRHGQSPQRRDVACVLQATSDERRSSSHRTSPTCSPLTLPVRKLGRRRRHPHQHGLPRARWLRHVLYDLRPQCEQLRYGVCECGSGVVVVFCGPSSELWEPL
jgi:hypothetical protein